MTPGQPIPAKDAPGDWLCYFLLFTSRFGNPANGSRRVWECHASLLRNPAETVHQSDTWVSR